MKIFKFYSALCLEYQLVQFPLSPKEHICTYHDSHQTTTDYTFDQMFLFLWCVGEREGGGWSNYSFSPNVIYSVRSCFIFFYNETFKYILKQFVSFCIFISNISIEH